MMPSRNWAGVRLGELLITRRIEDTIVAGDKRIQWECVCICGNIVVRLAQELRRCEREDVGRYCTRYCSAKPRKKRTVVQSG